MDAGVLPVDGGVARAGRDDGLLVRRRGPRDRVVAVHPVGAVGVLVDAAGRGHGGGHRLVRVPSGAAGGHHGRRRQGAGHGQRRVGVWGGGGAGRGDAGRGGGTPRGGGGGDDGGRWGGPRGGGGV